MKTEMPRQILVAFTGLAQSGKTTAAKQLCHEGFDRMSFADPIKQMVRCLTPETDKTAELAAFGGKSLRFLYQSLGTDWGRDMVDENIWVSLGRERLKSLLRDVEEGVIKGVVIDDLRFDNEAELIHELGGLVIKVSREGTESMSHASESGISGHLISYEMSNDTSVEELRDSVLFLCGLA